MKPLHASAAADRRDERDFIAVGKRILPRANAPSTATRKRRSGIETMSRRAQFGVQMCVNRCVGLASLSLAPPAASRRLREIQQR